LNHPSYEEEREHLKSVLSSIDIRENKHRDYIKILSKQNYGGSPLSHKISSEEVDEKRLEIYNKQLQQLLEGKPSPYFARMDFQYSEEEEKQKIYIGKNPLDLESEELNVVDWRSPIGNIYYSGSLGDCEFVYKDKNGKPNIIKGKKYLKRSIEIRNGDITKLQDLEVAIENKQKELEFADKFLIECLKESSDTRLKDVIATIQKDQNRIIREELDKIVYIQGCAGSGKSTIALHRIAYLIYNNKLKDEDILVIAPNKLFINYISSTLPELGSENVKQYTYRQFVENVMSEAIPVDYEKEEERYTNTKVASYVLELKGDLVFKNILEAYETKLFSEAIPRRDISVYGETLYSYSMFQEIFVKQFGGYKLNERIDRFKKYIEINIRERIKPIIESVEKRYGEELEVFKKQAQGSIRYNEEAEKLINEKDSIVNRIESNLYAILDGYFKDIKKIDAIGYYIELMTNRELLKEMCDGRLNDDEIDRIVDASSKGISEHDMAGMLYLYCRLNNIDQNKFKHIVVDESQDLSPFELYTLKEFSSTSSYTIVGDLSQSIIPYKKICTKNIVEKIFDFSKNLRIYNLTKSYRSSYEIMKLGRDIIKDSIVDSKYLPDPLKRYGGKPKLIQRNSDNEVIQEIIRQIDIKSDSIKNTAIILRTSESCKKVYEMIKDSVSVSLVTGSTSEYRGGITIIPAYLTKGLEFDLVIIPDGDSKSYGNSNLDRNMFYVQVTRALHGVVIIYKDRMSPILEKVNPELYEEEETERDRIIKIKSTRDTLIKTLKVKFGCVPDEIEDRIKNEMDFEKLQGYMARAAIEDDINKLFV